VSLLQLALFHLYPLVPLTGPDHQFFHVSNVIFGVYCKIIALHLEHKFDQGSQVLIAILIYGALLGLVVYFGVGL
jgi:hypothetical protein